MRLNETSMKDLILLAAYSISLAINVDNDDLHKLFSNACLWNC